MSYRLEALLSTKFLATIGCGFVTSLLSWHGKISDEVYGVVILGTVGAFITGVVIEKKAQLKVEEAAISDYNNSKSDS